MGNHIKIYQSLNTELQKAFFLQSMTFRDGRNSKLTFASIKSWRKEVGERYERNSLKIWFFQGRMTAV